MNRTKRDMIRKLFPSIFFVLLAFVYLRRLTLSPTYTEEKSMDQINIMRSSFFPKRKFFDVFSERDAPVIATHYLDLIKRYEKELVYQCHEARRFWKDQPNMHRCSGRIGIIEASMLYIMIREDKPAHVLEIGALCGSSTRWILEALRVNGKGMLSTFDLHDFSLEYMDKIHAEEGRWEFHHQDVFQYIKTDLGRGMVESVDLFFIDALHRNSFAQVYTNELLASYPHRISVFVHDIYSPFLVPPYKECQKNMTRDTLNLEIDCVKRKAAEISASEEYHNIDIFYGPTQAGGEGSELLSWLARTGRSNAIVTFSPYAAPTLAFLILDAFEDIGILTGQINNPAIFFELSQLE